MMVYEIKKEDLNQLATSIDTASFDESATVRDGVVFVQEKTIPEKHFLYFYFNTKKIFPDKKYLKDCAISDLKQFIQESYPKLKPLRNCFIQHMN